MMELNQKLLEKVEELVLHALQQENKMQDQNKDMVEMGAEITELKTGLQELKQLIKERP